RASQEYGDGKQDVIPSFVIERPKRDVEAGKRCQRPTLAQKNRGERVAERRMRQCVVPFRPVQSRSDSVAEVIEECGQDEGRYYSRVRPRAPAQCVILETVLSRIGDRSDAEARDHEKHAARGSAIFQKLPDKTAADPAGTVM